MLKKPFLILLMFYCHQLLAQNSYWQQQLHYTIDVRLNDREHTLDGFLKLEYFNRSPDTLDFIWFHLWPNAYRNDRTAFSEQRLRNGKTDFYFSSRDQKGYLNRLDFRTGHKVLQTEDHPSHIDIVKLVLNEPLAPGHSIEITTPFHVKIPALFSRMGQDSNRYSITQWYPKPAVYDHNGWHPMPYLDLGEYYSEFSSYDVRITLPAHYRVAATGELQDETEKGWMPGAPDQSKNRRLIKPKKAKPKSPYNRKTSAPVLMKQPVSADTIETYKTLRFVQQNVHDFAWFAAPDFIVEMETVKLPSGKPVDIFVYRLPGENAWAHALQFSKDALLFRSDQLGEYPYNTLSVVQGAGGTGAGMEYPGITIVNESDDPLLLDFIIQHEIGHNWFYSALGSNERLHPWMDEGLNTFYDRRYLRGKYGHLNLGLRPNAHHRRRSKLPEDESALLIRWNEKIGNDQPIATPADSLSSFNYGLISYQKAAIWLEELERIIGTPAFDNGIREYFRKWKGKHPQPADLEASFKESSVSFPENYFHLLYQKASDHKTKTKKLIRPAFIFNLRKTDSIHYISWMPLAGVNRYDRLMVGALVHNYNLPPAGFRFLLAPLYATGTKKLNGTAQAAHVWFGNGRIKRTELSVSANRYSKRMGLDSLDRKVSENFTRISPSVKIRFRKDPLQSRIRTIGFQTFLISENNFTGFGRKTSDSLSWQTFIRSSGRSFYYVNQLEFLEENNRALYRYEYQFQIQQGKGFYRLNLTAHYFYNYARGGGLKLRIFAGKFGYLGNGKNAQASLWRFQPKMMAVNGEEDYTYGNYFYGRSSTYASDGAGIPYNGFASQQIMVRDGGMKMRMDLFGFLQGRSDNWVSALNLNSTLPNSLLPFKNPLRLFADIGTYAEAWKKDAENPRFTYVAGIQLSLLNELINIYAPLVYSKHIRDNLKTVPEQNTFGKRISFSIDIHRFSTARILGNKLPLY